MKKTSKIFSVVLALVFVFAMAMPAFAANDGKITITNAVDGQDYTIYQMLNFAPTAGDATKGVYTIVTGWEEFFNGDTAKAYFDVTDGKVTLKTGATIDAALARAAVDYAKAKSIAGTTKKAEGKTVVFDGLNLGYFAVDTSLGAICSLTNTNSTATTIEKNEGPSIDKKIVENGNLVDANNVNIGDTITYQSKIHVGTGLNGYVMHDKMSAGLDYQAVTSVKIGGVEVDKANYTVKTTELADADCTFEIVFNDTFIAANAEKDIVVTYTAKLNTNAVIGETGNPNTVKLTYTNETVTQSTPDDIVITYTTKLTVNKVNDEGTALKGAGFTLYDVNDNPVGNELKGDDMTTFVWTGLKEGTYTIRETTVPAGYNKAEDLTIVITCTEPETVSATTDKATWTTDKETDVVSVTGGLLETTIKNTTGALLPETGGIGTTIFYILGGLLVVGAAIVLITRKRSSVEA